jgi:chromate reductase
MTASYEDRTMASYKVGYFVGSLSSTSINRELSKALIRLAPDDLSFSEIPIGNLPLYSPDYDADLPPEATALKEAIAASDAILFVTPEYNRSIPGALKNAIDWASRPPNQPFDGKPVAIMGASPSLFGTARAQYHLRQMMVFLNAFIVNRPEVMIGQAASKFDESGNLTDEQTREFIRKLLLALRDWTERLKKGAAQPETRASVGASARPRFFRSAWIDGMRPRKAR